jgi:hypothetical protein
MANTLSGQKSLDGIQGGRRPDTQGYTRTRAQVWLYKSVSQLEELV